MVRRTHHERTTAMQKLNHFCCLPSLIRFKRVALGRRRVASKCDLYPSCALLAPERSVLQCRTELIGRANLRGDTER